VGGDNVGRQRNQRFLHFIFVSHISFFLGRSFATRYFIITLQTVSHLIMK
jgi:hypothetical protein